MRPSAAARIVGSFFGISDACNGWGRMLLNAGGRLHPEEATFIPEAEQPRGVFVARVWVAIYAATILAAVITGSLVPLLLVGLPRLYGAWHHVMTGVLQHGGLAENVLDCRLNTRTVFMNPVSRFIYWNMNYHEEHHMFPMVPFHQLPKLHDVIGHDLPSASTSIFSAYRDVLPVLWRRLSDPDSFLRPRLPLTARPPDRTGKICTARHWTACCRHESLPIWRVTCGQRRGYLRFAGTSLKCFDNLRPWPW